MNQSLIIKGGRIIDPANNRDKTGDLFIAEGTIHEKLSPKDLEGACEIDASGKIVAPGFIDLRTHLREPGGGRRETIATGARAAAAGGFSTIVCMPDVLPSADNAGTIRYIQDAIAKTACINVLPTGCMTLAREGKNLAPIGSLKQAGVVAVTDCPNRVVNNEILLRTLEYSAMFDLPIFERPCDVALDAGAVAHEGAVSLRLGLRGSPRAAEELCVSRAAVLADVTPHHLALTDSLLAGYDSNFKTSPPLREEYDRQALLEGLMDGTIDCIATAHEPYLKHEKDVEFDLAPFGVVGLETALSVCLDAIVTSNIGDYKNLISVISLNPAGVLGLDKGTLSPGVDADVVIFDPAETWKVATENLESLSSNSPWMGMELSGRVSHLICGGKVVSPPPD